MYKKTLTYTDFDGNEREDTFYFNFTEAELMELELSQDGGLSGLIEKVSEEKDNRRIVAIFKDLLSKSIGEKSVDGKRFLKNDEIRDNFIQSAAYSKLFMLLSFDADEAAAFVKGVVPNVEESSVIKELIAKQSKASAE